MSDTLSTDWVGCLWAIYHLLSNWVSMGNNTSRFYLNVKSGSVTYEIKIKNCNIMEPHADVFQDLFPHRFSLPAQPVFYFCEVASFIIMKSCAAVKNCFLKLHVQMEFQVSDWLFTSFPGFSHLQID